jgi:hypothetical protein
LEEAVDLSSDRLLMMMALSADVKAYNSNMADINMTRRKAKRC